MQSQSYIPAADAAYTPPTDIERAFAPLAYDPHTSDEAFTVIAKPVTTTKPTNKRRKHNSACDRDDYLRDKAVNGDHMARTLMGWN